jgi:hypothetical protein
MFILVTRDWSRSGAEAGPVDRGRGRGRRRWPGSGGLPYLHLVARPYISRRSSFVIFDISSASGRRPNRKPAFVQRGDRRTR